MPIRVTCTSCHTRFNVSDKFAGKEGPCPKCKKTIRVPDKSEEVVIEAPETSGPKDSKGRSVLKPIGRDETKISSVQITIIAVCIVGFLLAALMLRMMTSGDFSKFPWLLYLAAIAMAPPIVYVAYHLLRDQELGSFVTSELRNRVLICSAIYALLWFAMPLARIAFNDTYGLDTGLAALVPMLGLGAATGMLAFDLDYLLGLVHYGMYLGICLIGREIAGLHALPQEPPGMPGTIAADWMHAAESVMGLFW
jgi:hypothetical protein